MGKNEEEQALSPPEPVQVPDSNAGPRCRIGRSVGFRCITALVLGVAVLLSAVFWLPPFLSGDRRPDQFGAPIAATFKLEKPVSLLVTNVAELESDIFDEIGVGNSMVFVTSLEPLAGSNWTNVVFGVWPYEKNSNISSPGISVLRASFESLVIKQLILHLNPSLFGDASSFQVLKFPGGITVIPPQSGFLLQKVILFNFTLNFSIHQIQDIFDELKYQLKSGLHLTPYENLYISLTNLNGSTLDPPIIVQSSILLAVGTLPPSRLRQLAQAITGSPARNLGLNHTVFGKVKQIQLSFLKHPTNSSTSSSSSLPPSPAPLPSPNRRHGHHHHHDHHHGHLPVFHPAPAPVPQHSDSSSPPPSCHFRYSREPKGPGHRVPAVVPTVSPHPSVTPMISPHPPVAAPLLHSDPPAPVPHSRPSSPPLPDVFLGHAQPPSKIPTQSRLPYATPSISPSSASSSITGLPIVHSFQWAYVLLLSLFMHL